MIALFSAIAGWLFVLAKGSIYLALVSIGIAYWRFKKSAVYVLLTLIALQLSMSLATHPKMQQIAHEFSVQQVSLRALENGQALTKVAIVKFEGCQECVGAKGSFAGSLSQGDLVTGNLMLRPAYGYGEFVAKGKARVSKAGSGVISQLRTRFIDSIAGISGDSKALVLGLSIGDTSLFSKSFSDQLKLLSLTHLNAVSGANCAIVVAGVNWLLGFVTRRRTLRVFLAISVLAGYVLLVGGSASVVRAAVMATIVLLAIDRGIWPLAALALTVALMLIYDPSFATDYGFALSVFATAGILILAPNLSERFSSRMPRWLALSLAVTIAAQLWCMPVLLDLQGGIPTYAVVANLLAEPVVAPITVLGIVAAVFAMAAPPLATVLSFIGSIPAQWIVAISEKLSKLPAATIGWHTGIIGMVIAVAALSFWVVGGKRFGAFIFAAVLVLECCFNAYALVKSSTWLPADWEIVNCDVGQGDALVIRSAEQIAVIDVGRDETPINDCLRDLAIKTINLLVLTHYDADHIGGLAGALAGRQVERVFLTPFRDTRPLVSLTGLRLRAVSTQQKVGYGVTGTLGNISFEVLSPSPTAEEAIDSNDGSVVMRWESPTWVLFTMADLGESGQMRLAERYGGYLGHVPGKALILKVAHHGSADTFPELVEQMDPEIALISVGKGNSYGHPTKRAIETLTRFGTKILRTDMQGSLAISGSLHYAVAGGG